MPKRPKTPPPFDEGPTPDFVADDPTKPIELIERSEAQYSSDMRFRDEMNAIRDEYDKNLAYRALYNMIRRQRSESNRTLSGVANTALAAHELAKQSDVSALMTWKAEVDTILRLAKWILGLVSAAALGSIVVIATKIYVWGQSSGELEVRIQQLEKQLQQQRHFPDMFLPKENKP